MINAYKFGEVIVRGKKFTDDVLVTPDGVLPWWREERHTLSMADVEKIVSFQPETVIVGTGTGLFQVSSQAQQYLAQRDIPLIIDPTGSACELYNQLSPTQRVVAALHLTC